MKCKDCPLALLCYTGKLFNNMRVGSGWWCRLCGTWNVFLFGGVYCIRCQRRPTPDLATNASYKFIRDSFTGASMAVTASCIFCRSSDIEFNIVVDEREPYVGSGRI